MTCTAAPHTPDKRRRHYLADEDLSSLVAQTRLCAVKRGLGRAKQLIAMTDAGNGLEEALRRDSWEDLLCVPDRYHACEHLHGYAKAAHGEGEQAAAWVRQAKAILDGQGGAKLLGHLRLLPAPGGAEAAQEHRKLIGYFANNGHRTVYPRCPGHGWDRGSGPTEAACKVVGARLKQSGMRWVEHGAAEVAPLRALYHSCAHAWDAFFALST
jgi:hypothetical protein